MSTAMRGLARGLACPRQHQARFASASARKSPPPPPPPPPRKPVAKAVSSPAKAPLGKPLLNPMQQAYKPPVNHGAARSPSRPPPPRSPKSQPSYDSSRPETVLSIFNRSRIPLTGAALVSTLLGFYIFGTIAASFKEDSGGPCIHEEHATPTGRPPALSGDNAEQFDKELDWQEWWMGITSLRKKLAQHAKGHVLELAMGTGRNLEYYDWGALSAAVAAATPSSAAGAGKAQPKLKPGQGIISFTGLDISVDMLDVARKKLVKAVPPMSSFAPVVKASTMGDHTGGQLSYLGGQLRFVHSDAHRPIPLASGPASASAPGAAAAATKYDTVIQTFGLCSVADPVAVLANLASVVKPETGRIILLEHGKGWYGVLNGLLDKNAGKHFEKFGCWWNRDIPALVDEAAEKAPGLEIVKIERPNILQMGTLVWVELRVAEKP